MISRCDSTNCCWSNGAHRRFRVGIRLAVGCDFRVAVEPLRWPSRSAVPSLSLLQTCKLQPGSDFVVGREQNAVERLAQPNRRRRLEKVPSNRKTAGVPASLRPPLHLSTRTSLITIDTENSLGLSSSAQAVPMLTAVLSRSVRRASRWAWYCGPALTANHCPAATRVAQSADSTAVNASLSFPKLTRAGCLVRAPDASVDLSRGDRSVSARVFTVMSSPMVTGNGPSRTFHNSAPTTVRGRPIPPD